MTYISLIKTTIHQRVFVSSIRLTIGLQNSSMLCSSVAIIPGNRMGDERGELCSWGCLGAGDSKLMKENEKYIRYSILSTATPAGRSRPPPSGRLMFQIIGAMAEFERALIQERVKAGLRNAQAKGKRLGRSCRVVDASRIAALRESGASWRAIARH